MKTEQALQTYFKKECKKHSIVFHKLESRSARGFPDCMVCKRGRVVFVELKAPTGKGKLHALQMICIAALRAEDLDVRVIETVDAVDQLIKELK